jgi:hypothetical protein
MTHWAKILGFLFMVCLFPTILWSDEQSMSSFDRIEDKLAPSMDKVRWTEAKISSDLNTEYDFVGGPLNEHYTDLRYTFTRRTMLAFLIHGGVEYQRLGFDGRDSLMLPGQLESANAYLALDFRWSRKDLVRIQSRPGIFGDFESINGHEFNAPVDIAYTRIPSNRIQWAVGLSIDTWRRYHVLPGGGVRYHVNDRWQLKFMLPTPQVEYKPTDVLTLVFGAVFCGDSYRLANNFGSAHGNPAFNNALVDYSEIRVGPGFSWNVKRLIEFNMQAGIVADRQFDYHNNGLSLGTSGLGSPFVTVQVHWLFKLRPPEELGPNIESGRFQTPVFQSLFQFL